MLEYWILKKQHSFSFVSLNNIYFYVLYVIYLYFNTYMLRLGHSTLKNGRLTYWLMIIISIVARLCQGLKRKKNWRHPLLSIPWSHLLLWGWWRERWETRRNRASEGAVGVDVCENDTISSFCVKMHNHLPEYTHVWTSFVQCGVIWCVCVC